MEHRENHTAGTQQVCQASDDLLGNCGVKIIQQVPKQNGVKRGIRITEVGLQESRSASGCAIVGHFVNASRSLPKLSVFLRGEIFPPAKDVLGRDAKTALDEEAQSSLPCGA